MEDGGWRMCDECEGSLVVGGGAIPPVAAATCWLVGIDGYTL